MMTRPRLLILDEPTAGVDIEIRRGMWRTLRDANVAGTTVILTTHYLEEAESLCRNIAIIDRGRIVVDANADDLRGRAVGPFEGSFELAPHKIATAALIDT
jgi:ABC-type multidrug transport system ATPase subunit